MATVRTLLHLVAANKWEVYHMDVNSAFFHGDLEEEVYIKLPPGFVTHIPTKCVVFANLSMASNTPWCYFKKLSDALLKLGFVHAYNDYSSFSFKN